MYALEQQVGRNDGLFAKVIDNGCIIPHANYRRGLLQFNVTGQVFNKPKLTQ
jgi:hypothetical protein